MEKCKSYPENHRSYPQKKTIARLAFENDLHVLPWFEALFLVFKRNEPFFTQCVCFFVSSAKKYFFADVCRVRRSVCLVAVAVKCSRFFTIKIEAK